MNVVMLSKAMISSAYRAKCELIGQQVGELSVFVPPRWGNDRLEIKDPQHYRLEVLPLRFSGNFHLHHYPTLRSDLKRALDRDGDGKYPDSFVFHIDEEAYNVATWHALRASAKLGAQSVFFTWQNIYRRYPPPFSWIEQHVYRSVRAAIAGSEQAAHVLREKGFSKPIHVVPQVGVDERVFAPAAHADYSKRPFTIGFAGRLIKAKGVDLLIHAIVPLGDARLHIVGDGEEKEALQLLVRELGMVERVRFEPTIPSAGMPQYYRELDCLALPSRTTTNWKEQFGRVLIEAMATGVPVVGAQSGEIPSVIGDAGLTFREGDVDELRARLRELQQSREWRELFGGMGRARVQAHYTMQQVANRTLDVYRSLNVGGS